MAPTIYARRNASETAGLTLLRSCFNKIGKKDTQSTQNNLELQNKVDDGDGQSEIGDVITKTGQVVSHCGAKIFNKFYKKNATGLSVKFTAGNISEIVQELLNAKISQVVVPTFTGSPVSLNFNDISKASQEELQKIAKALMDLFERSEFNSKTV